MTRNRFQVSGFRFQHTIRLSSLLLVVMLVGCTTTEHRTLTTDHSLPVPFLAQQPGQCGPAALAMVAQYYGHAVAPEAIARDIYLPEIHGTLTVELAEYAKRFGLWTRQYQGGWGDLDDKTAAGIPVIVLGKIGENYHYFVVLRASDPLIVHTDTRAFHRMSRDEFQRWWERAGRWTLVVCPPDKATWKLSAAEHNDLGLFYEKSNGDLCAAEAHYRQAVALQPANSYYQLNLGNALLGQVFLEPAAAAFRRAIDLDSQNADAMNNLAWTYHELGTHLDEAVTLCQRAVQLNPAKKAYYLDTLGSVLLKLGKGTKARAAFEQALAATTPGQQSLRDGIRKRMEAIQSGGGHE